MRLESIVHLPAIVVIFRTQHSMRNRGHHSDTCTQNRSIAICASRAGGQQREDCGVCAAIVALLRQSIDNYLHDEQRRGRAGRAYPPTHCLHWVVNNGYKRDLCPQNCHALYLKGTGQHKCDKIPTGYNRPNLSQIYTSPK